MKGVEGRLSRNPPPDGSASQSCHRVVLGTVRRLGPPHKRCARQQAGEYCGQVVWTADQTGCQPKRPGGRIDERVRVRGSHLRGPGTAIDHRGAQVGRREQRRGRDEQLVNRTIRRQVHLYGQDVDRTSSKTGGEVGEPPGDVVDRGPDVPQLQRAAHRLELSGLRRLGDPIRWRIGRRETRQQQIGGRSVTSDRDVPEDGEPGQCPSGVVARSQFDRVGEGHHGVDITGRRQTRGRGRTERARPQRLRAQPDVLGKQGADAGWSEQAHRRERGVMRSRPRRSGRLGAGPLQ